jgi:hypothetical protein
MIRKALLFAALMVVWAGVPGVVCAQDDPFTVRNVEVDVTAADAMAAREKAIDEAQRKAFERLVGRLATEGGAKAMAPPEGRALDELVRNFEVDSEKVSAVRYIATFTVRFKPDAIRSLLRSQSVTFTETQSRPLLVLPLYRADGALVLWDDPNPWREAWWKLGATDGVVPLTMPNGDIADVQDINAEQALAREPERIRAIAKRYGASGVLLAFATLRADGKAVDVTVTRTGTALPEQTLVFSFFDEPDVEGLLAKAAHEVRKAVEDAWKRDNVLRFDNPQTVTIKAPFSSLAEWADLRRRLASVPSISKTEIVSFTREAATLAVTFPGDEEQLAAALSTRDLALVQDGGVWTLTKR